MAEVYQQEDYSTGYPEGIELHFWHRARNELILTAIVTNEGSRGVPAGIDVVFRQTVPGPATDLATLTTTAPLLPGASERINYTLTGVPNGEDLTFEVGVDGVFGAMPEGIVEECDETDNVASGTERCDVIN